MIRGISVSGEVWSIDSANGFGTLELLAPRGWEYVGLATNARGESWAARQRVVRVGGQVVLELDPELVRLGRDGENEPRWPLAEGELPRGLAFARDGLCLGLLPTQPPELVRYDFASRQVLPLGPLALNSAEDLAWSEGRWFLWSNESGLFELDPWTRALTSLGPPPEPGSVDLRFLLELPSGRLVGGGRDLYDIDVISGLANQQAPGAWPELVGADREGPHCWYSYGTGCAGQGGFTPTLALAGCAAGGGSLLVQLHDAPGGAPLVILLGFEETRVPLGNGCDFYLESVLPTLLGGFASGENPGEGRLDIAIPLLHGTRGFCNAQAFVLDPSAPSFFTTSNAISLRVPY
ncbi:MAG: hypothetical protein JNM84_05700 [Planctomycetes bacterium]|nr:hypothetical protein [Planctomycetota bacterium]